MIVEKELLFTSSQEKVWDLLTNPELTKQYMYGCEVLSDWKIGDPIIWKGMDEKGNEVIYVKGTITEINKGQKVAFTMFDPNMGLEDIPENYVNLIYKVSAVESGETKLWLSQDFSGVANAKERYEQTVQGWDMVFPLMKKLLD